MPPERQTSKADFIAKPRVFGSGDEVKRGPGSLPPAARVPFEANSQYIVSAAHYQATARRIAAALRTGSHPFVLVTGDPAADPDVLSEELRDARGPTHTVIVISCGADLSRNEVERRARGCASPLFIFDEFDRLSDGQIEDVCDAVWHRGEGQGAAVLLTSTDFSGRLELPPLNFLKQRIAAQVHVQDVGDEEAIAFLHHQLLAQRDKRVEARGFRRGIAIGLAAGAVVLAVSLSAFVLRPTAEQVREIAVTPATRSPVGDRLTGLQPDEDATAGAAPIDIGRSSPRRSLPATVVTPLAKPEDPASTAFSRTLEKTQDPASAQVSSLAPTVAPPVKLDDPKVVFPPASAAVGYPRSTGSSIEPVDAAPVRDAAPAPSALSPPASARTEDTKNAAPSPIRSVATEQAGPRLSAVEVDALLARGDAFVRTGDITSARLYYERAADAGSGLAALRMGATFEPLLPHRAGMGAAADPAQALFWYRRARDLGASQAQERIDRIEGGKGLRQ